MTQPSEPADAGSGLGGRVRTGRAALLADRTLRGRRLTRALADQMDGWFHRLGAGLDQGWALAATGGYGRAQLFPGSDVDVVLVHPRQVSSETSADAARQLWYPMWDGGVKLSPAVHTERSLLQLAGGDLVTSTALLDIRHLAGDRSVTHQLRQAARQQWQKRPWMWLAALRRANEDRWAQAGDVSARLEPNLKDGRGGLRDVDAVRWALAMNRDDIADALDLPPDDLVLGAAALVDARAEVHRLTGRAANLLLLHDQDAVAEACAADGADALMIGLSAAARQIEWAGDRFWAEIDTLIQRSGGQRRGGARSAPLTTETVLRDGEVELTAAADLDDASLTFRVAAAAAHGGHRLARSTLLQLANGAVPAGDAWNEATRRAFLSLLGCGPGLVTAVDTLEFHGLFSRHLPEWRAIHSRPQRNAFHLYTVDRHLLQTVVEADRLVRTVSRPDLLLTAALLHDIGKGRTEDHTDLGVRLTREIAGRMGFAAADVEVLCTLVRCHLVLAETATRRDLDDPRTAEQVALQVGSVETLRLLHALTEADSRATGPTSWTPWKQRLVDCLVAATAATFRGDTVGAERAPLADGVHDLAGRAEADRAVHLQYWPGTDGDVGVVAVATPDRAGLFATIAGAFALHGVSVLSADVWTTADRLAVDQFQVLDGSEVNWPRVEQLIRRAMSGEVDLDGRIRSRLAAPRLRRRADAAAAPVTEIQIRNDASTTATMIDVRSPDAEAVLYRLAVVLRDHALDIQSAKVATLGHEIVDVFYVQRDGDQITPSDHDALRAELARALAG